MAVPADLIEFAAVMIIPVMALGLYGMLRVGRSPIGTALARRIEARGNDQMAELEDRLQGLESQLLETQERLDFTERMLARQDPHSPVRPPHWEETPQDGIVTPV